MFSRVSRTLAAFAAVSLMLASSLAMAGGIEVNSKGTVLPYRGMYYEHGHGGTGLTVDVDKNGYVFAVFYAYDKAGKATYYLMEGLYQPNDPDTMIHTGVIGTLDAPVYISENGQCVGSDCPYRSPDRAVVDLTAHLTWSSPRKLHLEIGDQSWDITAGQYTATDEDFILGDWIWISTHYDTYGSETLSSVSAVNIAKTNLRASQFSGCAKDANSDASNFISLPSDSVIYTFYVGTGNSYYLYLSQSSHSSGLFSALKCFGGYGKPVYPGTDILVTGPNGFRVYYEYTTRDDDTEIRQLVEARLVRMPEGSKLYQEPKIGF